MGLKGKSKSKKFLYWLIPVCAGGAFFAVVGIGAAVKANTFWDNTYIGDVNIGGKTVEEVENMLESIGTLTVKTRDGKTETIDLSRIDFKADVATRLEEIKKSQTPFLWFANAAGKKEYDLGVNVSFDKEKLKSLIANLKCISDTGNIKAPTDAYLAYKNGQLYIEKETAGNQLDSDKVLAAIEKALNNTSVEVDLDAEGCYVEPQIKSDDPNLTKSLAEAQKLNNAEITIDLTGASEKVDPTTYIPWITTDESGSIALDEDLIYDYVADLSMEYNTYGTERKFTTTNSGTITVGGSYSDISGNDSYGFQMDIDTTIEDLTEAILSGETQTIEATWRIPALTRNASNGDIGNTYVEIDVSQQHMWYYVDGDLYVSTDVRTGTESATQDTPTPSGVYRILDKITDKWFTDFEPVCHSDYWMPMDWRGDGIHDATWYSTFGGTLYLTSGSHGCINTPYDEVEQIFNKITIDTPVIVYRSDNY